MKDFIVIDVESTGLSPQKDKLHGIGIAWEEGVTEYFGVWEIPAHFREVLANPKIAKVGHRIRFDLKFLERAGVAVRGPIYCTRILAHLIDENAPIGLKALSQKHFGKEALEGKNELDLAIEASGAKTIDLFNKLDLEDPTHPYFDVISKYCQEDCNNTLRLFYVLKEKLKSIAQVQREKLGLKQDVVEYYLKECMPLEKVLMKMELQGIDVNRGVLNDIRSEIEGRQTVLLASLNELAREQIVAVEERILEKEITQAVDKCVTDKGKLNARKRVEENRPRFNWGSGAHLGRLLLAYGLSDLRRTKGGAVDTSEAYLGVLRADIEGRENMRAKSLLPVFDAYGEYKKTIKTLGTYVEGMEERIVNEKIYGQYTQEPVTGRLSSVDPNMQNLPRTGIVKKLFVPPPGHVFVHRDYSQVEMRVAAHLSQDETMLQLFLDKADPHRALAAKIFKVSEADVTSEQRQVGKTCNFLLIFWGSAYRLREELAEKCGLDYSIEECEDFRNAFWEMYPGMRSYLDRQLEQMKRVKAVWTETGRVRRLPDVKFGEWINWRNREFTGPQSVREELERLIASGNAPKRVYEQPQQQRVFQWAVMKFGHAKKAGFNMPIQGLSASITKRAIIEMDKQGLVLATTVHDSIDEIVAVAPGARVNTALGSNIMRNVYKLSVPLEVDVKILNSLHEQDKYSITEAA